MDLSNLISTQEKPRKKINLTPEMLENEEWKP